MTKLTPRIGVAVLILDSVGRLLLGRRGKEPNYGKWVIPGGGLKYGETIENAARREVREETGLEIELERSPFTFIQEVLGGGEHRVILFFRALVAGGSGSDLKASSDLLEAHFFAVKDIPVNGLSPVVVPVLKEMGWISDTTKAIGPLPDRIDRSFFTGLEQRGFSCSAYEKALEQKNKDAITLTHPCNWMTEAEVEKCAEMTKTEFKR